MNNEEIAAAYEKEVGHPYRPARSTDPDDKGLTLGDFLKITLVIAAILAVIVYFA